MATFSVILFLAAALFLGLGISVYRGNTKLISDCHQKNVPESQQREYGRAVGKSLFTICGTLALAASFAVLAAGLIASAVLLVRAQKKYNATKYMEQTVTPSNRDSYTFSAQIATENLSLGSNGQVGVEIVIEYEDGSTETRTIDLISSSDTEV